MAEESGDEATVIVMRVCEPAQIRLWRPQAEQPLVAAKSSSTAVC
jgi:hypothetical protein